MDRANAYAVLASELEKWRLKPRNDVASLVGAPPTVSSIEIAGEVVTIEISVTTDGTLNERVRVEATANGSSHWNLERLVEHISLPRLP